MKTRIQELRKQNKVTQEELAMALGVTRQTIISLSLIHICTLLLYRHASSRRAVGRLAYAAGTVSAGG